jgi:hypothetical protein
MIIRCVLILAFGLLVGACDGVPGSKTASRDCRDCLYAATLFYSSGGDVFDEKGCTVNTSRDEDTLYISAQDEYSNYERTARVSIPVSWFETEREKLPTLEKEFSAYMACFSQTTKEEKAKNPLFKEVPKDDGCRWISLRINDVPGSRVECENAPHFSFEALEKR